MRDRKISPDGARVTKLLERLQVRNADREHATDGGTHSRRPVPPVATKHLRLAERAIGFPLPELVRAIYHEIGSGGFGPQYGIVGITGGAKLDGHTLETCYQSVMQLDEENPVWRWPARLLPLANYGCGMWSCVDCEYRKLPMILWDPNNLHSDLEAADARFDWGNSFWDQGRSFWTWLEGWLAGLPEPKRPSHAWMKRRLGLASPK